MTQPREWLKQPGGVSDRLTQLRDAAGLSGKDLADALGWGAPKVSKIERGRQVPSPADVVAWVRRCGGGESVEGEILAALDDVVQAHRDWRRQMRLGQASTQARHTDLVAESSVIRHFETLWVPGLLQTPAYARRVLAESARLHGVERDDLDEAIRQRMARQQHLYDPSKAFEFLLAEPVLRWRLLPPPQMREQLDRLQTVVDLGDRIRFGILPLDVEIVTAPQNSFVAYDDLVVVETFVGESEHADEQAARYLRVMEMLWQEAATGPAARRLLVAAVDALAR